MATADASVKTYMESITDGHLDYIQNLQTDRANLYNRHQKDGFLVGVNGDYVATLTSSIEPGAMQVFVNGLMKKETDDYSVSLDGNGMVSAVTVLSAEAGDDVIVMGQKYFTFAS